MEILKNYSTEIIGVVSFVIGLIVPIVIKKGKVILGFIKGKIGDANYNECKTFLENLYELHKEDFSEDKIVSLLDLLDNKFGDHLSRNTIKEIVETVAGIVIADVAKEVAK
ncbi:hypothetical protein SAMN02745134_00785 [Clostridium acidisoli DSM 12555]|uniref:Bacteriophage holin of superfamily 6 (Holin_LLH) n=1 Tax=Clostridium acidisoli DSM 12555 TaxID=1121291 RepID=A0A1W1X5S9_9CLOT|nr:hypothetical protein [Clostridium acidisoli]SMC19276.1 hypothetical protein SAMN02745134_00785 [Clostridium acidisoli DSM 12555]